MIVLSNVPAIGFTVQPANGGFTWSLASVAGDLLTEAELRFGQRDQSWTFCGVEFSPHGPQIWFPGDRKNIVIQLSMHATTDWRRAVWQLAHEIIHLLAPVKGEKASNFEEGLAALFADQIAAANQLGWSTASGEYLPPKVAVAGLLHNDPSCVKRLRALEPRMQDLTIDLFRHVVPAISYEQAAFLVAPFAGRL